MSVESCFLFELRNNGIKSVIMETREILKNLTCPYECMLSLFVSDFKLIKQIDKQINKIYSLELQPTLYGIEEITKEKIKGLNNKYFNILRNGDINSLTIILYSVYQKDLDKKRSKSIKFIFNENWEPSIGFHVYEAMGANYEDDRELKLAYRKSFFQECFDVLNLRADVEIGKESTYVGEKVLVKLKDNENNVTLKILGHTPLGPNEIFITPQSKNLEDAIILFKKLLEANIFEIKLFKFSIGGDVQQLLKVIKKHKIPYNKIEEQIFFNFDEKILDVFKKLENINGEIFLHIPFDDFEDIENSSGSVELKFNKNKGNIFIEMDTSRDIETTIKHISNITNKKLIFDHYV